MVSSRSGSRQIAQGWTVSRLPQIGHGRIASAAFARAAASGSSRLSRRLIRCNAARRAERGPRPGSFARSCTSVSSSDTLERQLEAARQLQTAGQLLHLLLGVSSDLAPGIIEGGDDQVLQDLDLTGVD